VKIGDEYSLKITPEADPHMVTLTYVGSKSVQVKDELGRIHSFNKRVFLNKLGQRPKRQRSPKRRRSVWMILTPTGGQPGYRRR
jgi:hypothetical protein